MAAFGGRSENANSVQKAMFYANELFGIADVDGGCDEFDCN